jgi:uncharacterized membrane protein YjgN (DUF898 family)
MDNRTFRFTGKAGDYFGAAIVAFVCCLIPIFGWPIAYNTVVGWVVDHLLVDGKKVKYSGEYGEVLVFLLTNFLLIFITLGIYTFWYVPRQFRFIAEHTTAAE